MRGGGRGTRAVLEDHLRKRSAGEVEEDLAANYAEAVVLLTGFGVFRGKRGVRRCAALLAEELPCGRYRYGTKRVAGELAFLEWSARCPEAEVEDGADSFLIRGGRIVAQTIHYTVRPRARARRRPAAGGMTAPAATGPPSPEEEAGRCQGGSGLCPGPRRACRCAARRATNVTGVIQ